METVLKGGMIGPVSWYKVWTSGLAAEEDEGKHNVLLMSTLFKFKLTEIGIPIRSPAISKPTFFAATTQDFVCVVKPQINLMKKACADLTTHEFEAGHWVMLEKKDEFNEALSSWLEGLVTKHSA